MKIDSTELGDNERAAGPVASALQFSKMKKKVNSLGAVSNETSQFNMISPKIK